MLAESVHLAQVSAEQHTIFLDIESQDSKLVADKLRISQVIGNILDNAVKFSPQGKQVTVTLKEQGNEYLVSISDRGIGVSPSFSITSSSGFTACAIPPAASIRASAWASLSPKPL